jgi:hypothetical protein
MLHNCSILPCADQNSQLLLAIYLNLTKIMFICGLCYMISS